MKNNQTILMFVVLILAGSVIACSMFGGSNSNGNSNANANTAANTTVNKRDPKKFCYLEGFGENTEYKSGSSGYSCLSFKNGNLPSGGFHSIIYGANGDANNVERVHLRMLASSKRQDVGEADESFAQACGELWQRVFAAALPNDIKESILADKGKAVKMEKKFTEPTNGTVSREPGNGGTYTLLLELALPK